MYKSVKQFLYSQQSLFVFSCMWWHPLTSSDFKLIETSLCLLQVYNPLCLTGSDSKFIDTSLCCVQVYLHIFMFATGLFTHLYVCYRSIILFVLLAVIQSSLTHLYVVYKSIDTSLCLLLVYNPLTGRDSKLIDTSLCLLQDYLHIFMFATGPSQPLEFSVSLCIWRISSWIWGASKKKHDDRDQWSWVSR